MVLWEMHHTVGQNLFLRRTQPAEALREAFRCLECCTKPYHTLAPIKYQMLLWCAHFGWGRLSPRSYHPLCLINISCFGKELLCKPMSLLIDSTYHILLEAPRSMNLDESEFNELMWGNSSCRLAVGLDGLLICLAWILMIL